MIFLQTCKRHSRSGHQFTRCAEIANKGLRIPNQARVSGCRGIAVPGIGSGLSADDAIQYRPDRIFCIRTDLVTTPALCENRGAHIGIARDGEILRHGRACDRKCAEHGNCKDRFHDMTSLPGAEPPREFNKGGVRGDSGPVATAVMRTSDRRRRRQSGWNKRTGRLQIPVLDRVGGPVSKGANRTGRILSSVLWKYTSAGDEHVWYVPDL
jgi:hypothetical protein